MTEQEFLQALRKIQCSCDGVVCDTDLAEARGLCDSCRDKRIIVLIKQAGYVQNKKAVELSRDEKFMLLKGLGRLSAGELGFSLHKLKEPLRGKLLEAAND